MTVAEPAWPVRCPVDDQWANPQESSCRECRQPLAPLRALSSLAREELALAAVARSEELAVEHVERAEALVAQSEDFLADAATALVAAGAIAPAISRMEAAVRLAPRREDIGARLAALRTESAQPAPKSKALRRTPSPLVVALVSAPLVVALGAFGAIYLSRPDSTATPSSSAVAIGPSSSPDETSNPTATPTSSPDDATAPPSPRPERDLVETIRLAMQPLDSATVISIEHMGSGVIQVSGVVPDALTRDAIIRAVSGTSGVDSVIDDGLLVKPTERTVFVLDGDTLWTIAQRTYGDGAQWRRIASANPGIDPRRLEVRDELVVPDAMP